MDELEFRRRVVADPDTTDPDTIAAAKADPAKRDFLAQQKRLNQQLASAVQVDVPEDLAHKLIWHQSAREFAKQRRRNRWHIALAASVAFMVGIGFTLWSQKPLSLESQALAHMRHAQTERELASHTVSLDEVNAKLAGFGALFTGNIGTVEVANYCHLGTLRSVHLIVSTNTGDISVFIIPPSGDTERQTFEFANDQYHGQGMQLASARIMVVGERQSDVQTIFDNVSRQIYFSA